MTTEEQEQFLAELKDLEQAATPGPWYYRLPGAIIGHSQQAVVKESNNFDWICSMQVSNCPNFENDAALIAAMRNRLPGLLELVNETQHAYDAQVIANHERIDWEEVHLREIAQLQQQVQELEGRCTHVNLCPHCGV